MAKRTERIEFDFTLWGQEGVEVWHEAGREAVYVGELSNGNLLIHWADREYGIYGVHYPFIYMTRQVKQKTFEEVIEDAYNVTNPMEYTWYSLADDSKEFYRSFVNEVINRAKEEGLI